MYSSIMMVLILILPIPVLVRELKRGTSPYRAIVQGTLAAGVGIAFIFALAQIAGDGLSAEVGRSVSEMAKAMAGSDQMAQALGMADAGRQERIAEYKKLYDQAAQMLPSVLLITAVVVSWIEGIIIGRSIRREGIPVNPVPPLRELSLPKSAIIGWLIIMVITWILSAVHFPGGSMLLSNANILFEFTFALQGMALIFVFAYKKRIPKAAAVIVVIILWLISIGQMVMFFMGIIDVAFNLRNRIKNRG
ncbi:MAG: DUF2232 domain-containing protein [Anaerovoracaceae bacterium]|jgi:uncharacterized protein YybS (DUF2232 family)